MKNYWIQTLLYLHNRDDYRYDDNTLRNPWLICDSVIKKMLKTAPKYIRLTISTRPLKNCATWRLKKGPFGWWVQNLETKKHHLIFSEMENWLLTLDNDVFYITAEKVDAATYQKGL